MPAPPVILATGGPSPPKRIEYEGAIHEFPGDFTDEDIARALRSMSTPPDAPTPKVPDARDYRGPGVLPGVGATTDLGQNLTRMGDVAKRAGGTFLSNLNPVPLIQAAASPVQTLRGMVEGNKATAKEAADAFNRGDYGTYAGKQIAAIPLAGPMIEHTAGRLSRMEVPEMIGDVASMVVPGVALSKLASGVSNAAPVFRKSAETSMTRVLDATKDANKFKSAEVVPGLVKRRVVAGSLEGLRNQAAANVQRLGQAIGDAWDNLPEGTNVNADDVITAIRRNADEAHKMPDASGVPRAIGDEAQTALNNVDGIAKTIESFAERNPTTGVLEIPAAKMRKMRQYFDRIVDQAGGHGGKTLSDTSKAEAYSMAVDEIRSELAKNFPDIATINKEFHFWRNVQQVADATLLRKQGQQGGIRKHFATVAGATSGAIVGGASGAAIGATAAPILQAAMTSTAWRTVSASLKDRLADAIAKGNKPQIEFYAKKAAQAARVNVVTQIAKPSSAAAVEAPRLVASNNERERR